MIFQDKKPASISQTLYNLKNKGYGLSFRREAASLYCYQLQERIFPEEFSVDEAYYFLDIINPDSDRTLYAITLINGRRGFMIDACNVYSDNISYEMELKLHWQYPLVP